jgi:conjugal transfer/type IV secretion protein DotA/TraY
VSEATWDTVNSARFNEIVGQYEAQIVSDLSGLSSGANATLNVGLNAFLTSLTNEGWANAGGWFQRVGQVRFQLSTIFSEPPGSVGEPVLTGLPSDAASREFISSVALARDITRKSETHNDYTTAEVQPEDVASAIPSDPQGAVNIGQMKTDMDAKMSSWVNNAMHKAVDIAIAGDGSDGTSSFCGTAGEIGGSLNRMKCLGDYFTVTLNAARAMDTTLKTAVAVLRVGAGVLSSVKGVGTGLDLDKIVNPIWDWVMAVPVPVIAKMVTYLEALAFYFGVFLPALPYGLFMIVFVGWVLSVLQTMLAAPLWAVMHMTPDRTFIGSQRQGYLLLMSLFIRPALAVVGLFAGVLVSDPLIDFVARSSPRRAPWARLPSSARSFGGCCCSASPCCRSCTCASACRRCCRTRYCSGSAAASPTSAKPRASVKCARACCRPAQWPRCRSQAALHGDCLAPVGVACRRARAAAAIPAVARLAAPRAVHRSAAARRVSHHA